MADVMLMGDPRVAAVPVVECDEPLVDTRQVDGVAVAEHDDPRSEAYPYLRRAVADRLADAGGALPDGLRILLVEGYRPYELQDFYFRRHVQRLRDADPALDEQGALLAASRFVSPPHVAPHVSGAAVDVTLVDADGVELGMGTPLDASPEESDNACYFAAGNISPDARENRRVLAQALTSAGLVNYPTEWWHWSYGDRYWALATGSSHAVYGPQHLATSAPTRL